MTEGAQETAQIRFEGFVLDVSDRQLWRGAERIDLNARYFDALVLLVRERDRLVDKDRFFNEVWGDVVVSDSALSQCIKEIRRLLGDNASRPRFIQTVPRHGYRFIAHVEAPENAPASRPQKVGAESLRELVAGTLGGGWAGLLGGLLYGFGLASSGGDVGTLSTLLVLISLGIVVGLTGGFGVSLGLAAGGMAGHLLPTMRVTRRVAGAALGGMFVGALANLLGLDAFNLLFGRAPDGITGGLEGATLGSALALGAHAGNLLGDRSGGARPWHTAVGAGVAGALAGASIPAVGGRLLGGSLELLSQSFADSRLHLESFGAVFGELHFGTATQIGLGAIEGFLFGSLVLSGLGLMRAVYHGRGSVWRV